MEKYYLYFGAAFAFLFFLITGLFISRFFSNQKSKGNDKIFLKATRDKDEAAQSLLIYLNRELNRSNKELAVYEGSDTFDGKGWIFFWDTRKFLETKNPGYGLKGSNPVLYDKETGLIEFIPPTEVFKYFGEKKGEDS